ncbi:MAG: HAD-IIIA family hydrolase [Candidatus Helarchaeota archaeon]
MPPIICVDRDGTLIYDEKYHLGRQSNWKSLVQVLDTVIEGLRILKSIPGVRIYMITNQPGVAVKDFTLLTIERAHEVCQYVLEVFVSEQVPIDGYFLCPHASYDWKKQHSDYNYREEFVGDCRCAKPKPGMVEKILEREHLTWAECRFYILGDRITDVQLGINVGGIGILIPSKHQLQQIEKVKNLPDLSRVYIAKNFLDAATFIQQKEREYFYKLRREWERERLQEKLDLDLLDE